MTSIGELFPKCNKLAYDARQELQRIQSGNGVTGASDLNMILDELERQLSIMEEELVLREPAGQREKWKRKIRDLRVESQSLREQGRVATEYRYSATSSLSSSRYQSERQELLRRRRQQPSGSEESDLQNLAAEGESLEQSHLLLNSLIDQGSASLSNLYSQRQQLRGVRGVLTQIGNRLGLTQSTMRIIERRDITDAYLVVAGMVVTCIVIYFVWF